MSNTTTQLTIREEITATIGDFAQPMTHIEERLGYLHQQAEQAGDQDAMQLVVQTWEQVQVVNQAAQTAQELAVAAKEAAETFNQQRDQALQELGNLNEAIDNPLYTDNERIQDLVEFIEEYAAESTEEYLGDVIYEQIFEVMHSNLQSIGVALEKADRFTDYLFSGHELSKLPDDQKAVLRDFIEQFVVLEDES